jgi:Domain of unknown function (DUF4124)
MRTFLLLAGLAISLAAASQEIYRWVDKNGIVHYSDSPDSPDAKLIDVIEPNAYEGEASAPGSGGGDDAAEEEESGESPYTSFAITSPSPDQVFFGADATVNVSADLGGTLRRDHSVVFFLNGNRHPADGLSLQLSNLARGSYFLRASVLDQNGNPVITSPQTTFHVRMPSILSPQSPQAPRPRTGTPRPRATPRT